VQFETKKCHINIKIMFQCLYSAEEGAQTAGCLGRLRREGLPHGPYGQYRQAHPCLGHRSRGAGLCEVRLQHRVRQGSGESFRRVWSTNRVLICHNAKRPGQLSGLFFRVCLEAQVPSYDEDVKGVKLGLLLRMVVDVADPGLRAAVHATCRLGQGLAGLSSCC